MLRGAGGLGPGPRPPRLSRFCAEIAALAVLCSACAPEARKPATALSPPASPVASYPYAALARHAAPKLGGHDARRIRAVHAATRAVDRSRLMFALVRGRLVMFYGPPVPGETAPPPAFRIIGSCNEFIRDGETYAGTGLGCLNWKPSSADRAAGGTYGR
jgi:hypothetical protein